MKILFMTPNARDDVSINFIYYLEKAIADYVECKWAGRGYELYQSGKSLDDTVKRVMPDADWVIFHERGIHYFDKKFVPPKKRDYKIALYTYDLHWNPGGHIKVLNSAGWDAFLMRKIQIAMGSLPGTKGREFARVDPNLYIKKLNAPIFYNAPSVHPEVFKPSGKAKKYDVTCLGAHPRKYYPFRDHIFQSLPTVAKSRGWRLMIKGVPPGRVLRNRTITKLLKEGQIVGPRYASILASSKVFIFGTSIFKEALLKFPEGMACGTCVCSDVPLTAKELHYEPDKNFIAINRKNWVKKLTYYLNHDDEREKIAKRGYETFLKYHTSDVRARQLVEFLERNI